MQEAIKIFDQAVSEQAAGYKAFLSLRLLGLLPSGQRRQELIAGLAGSVIELGSMGAEQRLDDSFRQIALPSLVVLRLENRQNDFTKLLEYLEQSGECSSAERYKTFESLYAVCAQQSTSDAAAFLRDIVADFGANPAAQQSVLSAVTTLIVRDKDFSYSHRYIDLIKGRNPDLPLDEADYIAVGFITSHILNQDNIKEIESLDRLPSQLRTASAQNKFGYAFACYFEMLRQERLGRIGSAIKDAKELVELLSNSRAEVGVLNTDVRSTIEDAARSLLRRYEPKVRVVNPYKGIGRNTIVVVRYGNGKEVTAKFKAVQRDLVLGSCELLQQ